MLRRSRRKRAAVGDIYRTCIRFGNCPPDVKNKVENNTIADKILKWASGAIYLGSLGIGTSSSGSGIRIGAPSAGTLRPTLPVDAIGPREVPIQPGLVRPEDPSVFNPFDVTTDDIPVTTNEIPVPPPEIELLPLPKPDPNEILPKIPVPRFPVAVDDPIGPEVTISEGGEYEGTVPSIVPQPPRGPLDPLVVSRSQYSNPAFEISVHTETTAGEFSTPDSVVIYGGGGEIIGEEIPLVEFMRPEPTSRVLEEETEFATTSTPEGRPPAARRPALTNVRHYQQVRVDDPAFLSSPARLVTFDNPVFEEDVTMEFLQDVDEVLQAPDPDFRDIIRLGRAEATRLPGGRVRVSRVGQRATMKTRSGAVIGPKTHFYKDLSSIANEESIPLTVFGEVSGESSIAQPLAETGLTTGSRPILADPDLDVVFLQSTDPDETLLDEYEDVGSNAQLIVTMEDNVQPRTSILPEMLRPPFIFPEPGSDGVHVHYPESDHGHPAVNPDVVPHILLDIWSDDYYLHPSLVGKLRRRRRRKQIFVY